MVINKYNIIIATLLIFVMSACSKVNIEPWSNQKGYVWFTSAENFLTFRNYPQVEDGQVCMAPIQVSVASTVEDRDRYINMEIVKGPKDARTKVELVTPAVFRAGHSSDSVYLKVLKSSHLNTMKDTVVIRVKESDDFLPGLESNVEVKVCICNSYQKPSWWTSDADYFFGYYDDLKLDIFIAVSGASTTPLIDATSWWSSLNVTYLVQLMKDYVVEHDIRYPSDGEHNPGQAPVFASYKY